MGDRESTRRMPAVIILEKTPAQRFSRALVSLKFVQHIQSDLSDAGVAKLDLKKRYLNQAYILHLIALWQVFVEDLARYGLKLGREAGTHGDSAAADLEVVLGGFNTPKRKNIDKLFKTTLGIAGISQYWVSEELPGAMGEAVLDRVLNARHEIAHTGATAAALSYEANFADMEVLVRMANLTEAAVIRLLALDNTTS